MSSGAIQFPFAMGNEACGVQDRRSVSGSVATRLSTQVSNTHTDGPQ
jgi:hypothetical protein